MQISSSEENTVDVLTTTGQVIRWWELRRLLYNATLLVIGVMAVAGMEFLIGSVLPTGEDAVEPLALLAGIVLYGVMANICYTAGWVVELKTRRNDAVIARQNARWMFRAGMLFSCLLTTMPLWFGAVFWMLHPRPAR